MATATYSAVVSVAKKKSAGAKKRKSVSSHPPFLEMISEAIVTLKERTGSSQYAITKFIEEKHKQLPPNFRKILLVQVKRFVASGKLVKVKASYKLPSTPAVAKKPAAAKPKAASSAAPKPKPKTAKTAAKEKTEVANPVKPKAKIAAKPKATIKPKAKPAVKPTKASKTAKKSTPGKKVKTPVKKVVVKKKPKTVKSPAKKVAPKKAKK